MTAEEIKKKSQINQDYIDRLQKKLRISGKPGKLALALIAYHRPVTHTTEENHTTQYNYCFLLAEATGRPIGGLESLEDFLSPTVRQAIELMVGKDDFSMVLELLRLRVQGQFSNSIYRRAYRSRRTADYVPLLTHDVCQYVIWQSRGLTLKEVMMERDLHGVSGFDNRLAVALAREDEEICPLVEEALLGDNAEVILSYAVIRGIMISGNRHFMELLGKLLLAASRQEGLRQSILESADLGNTEVLSYFLKLVVDNGLTRFSSVIRAVDTWTGLGFSNEKPKVAEKCASLALQALESGEGSAGLESSDVLEIYFALWGAACRDINVALEKAYRIMESGEKYRRLTALYFISHSDSESACHKTAVRFIDSRDDETLAWLAVNLYTSSSLKWMWSETERKRLPSPSSVLPESLEERRAQFDNLAQALVYIGNKKKEFTASIFPWTSVTLTCESVLWCMMSLAQYDLSTELTTRLIEYAPYMTVEQRRSLLIKLIGASEIPEQRDFIRASLSDKSQHVRSTVVDILAGMSLDDKDITFLTNALAAKSGSVRKDVISLLLKQPASLLDAALRTLLTSKGGAQAAAGAELAQQAKGKSLELSAEVQRLLGLNEPEELPAYGEDNGFGLFDPGNRLFVPAQQPQRPPEKKGLLAHLFRDRDKDIANDGLWNDEQLKKKILVNKEEIRWLLARLDQVIDDNLNYEYLALKRDGSQEKVLLGDNKKEIYPLGSCGKEYYEAINDIDCYPLADIWKQAMGEYAKD